MKNSFLQIVSTPKIKAMNFDINDKFESEDENLSLDLEVKNRISKVEDQIFECEIDILLFKDIQNSPFSMSLTLNTLFRVSEESESNMKILEVNGPAILFSYARPFVTNITSQAGLPPLVLPVINFTDK